MAFVVRGHTAHMLDILVAVFGWVFFRVLLQDFDNLAAARCGLATNRQGILCRVFVKEVMGSGSEEGLLAFRGR